MLREAREGKLKIYFVNKFLKTWSDLLTQPGPWRLPWDSRTMKVLFQNSKKSDELANSRELSI